jgi:hypothetical protein
VRDCFTAAYLEFIRRPRLVWWTGVREFAFLPNPLPMGTQARSVAIFILYLMQEHSCVKLPLTQIVPDPHSEF